MSSEILQTKKWNDNQKKLLEFLLQTEPVSGEVIRQWIASSIVHFTDLNVPQNIISHFLTKMEHVTVKGEKMSENDYYLTSHVFDKLDKKESAIGPFVFVGTGYQITDDNRLSMKIGGRVKMTPVLVAFDVAQNIIDKYENEVSIIPKVIINELDNYKESKGIASYLRDIQFSLEAKDIKTTLASLISATEQLLKLIPELPINDKLGKKLISLHDNISLLDKYSIKREIIWSLNNSRIIRNFDTHEPSDANRTTTYEAVGYVHLLNLMIFSMLSSGAIELTVIDNS